MHPVQKIIPKKMSSVVGPTQSFFMRESKPLGVSQLHSGPYRKDSLASTGRGYKPGTECNPTRRWLIQHEVSFMSDMVCQIGDVQRRCHSDLTSPLDFAVCILKGLTSQFVTSIPDISVLEMSQVMRKVDLNKTKVLAPWPLPLGILHSPRSGTRATSLRFLTWWWLQFLISPLILSTGCPDYEWALPHGPRWPPDDPHGGLCTHLYDCVVPSLGRYSGE